MVKKGDTLIEVTLAIGIFSMIAITIVSVMSSGTAGAQTALETTLAREEIDTQAEALRFIQSSAVSDKNSADKRFYELWKKITEQSFDINGKDEGYQNNILQYAPGSCSENYENRNPNNKAFVINPRQLGNYAIASDPSKVSVLYTFGQLDSSRSNKILTTATTYPRLVFDEESERDLTYVNNSLISAEGIYIIAVKDPGTTNIGGSDNVSAYYDFYIRTCWYGINANEPSTISTVIRLYDPDALSE